MLLFCRLPRVLHEHVGVSYATGQRSALTMPSITLCFMPVYSCEHLVNQSVTVYMITGNTKLFTLQLSPTQSLDS